MSEYKNLSDGELIGKCLAQDADAWETLIRRYQRLIISVALKSGLTHDDALDVLQSVCLILLRKLQTLREQEKLSAWLIVVAKHEAWKFKERGGKVSLLEDEEWERIAETADAGNPIPDEQVLNLERQHMIRRAEEQLSAPCRQLLSRLFSEAQSSSYTEISRDLGIPVASIGPTRGRCLAKMKDILRDLGFE
jgi:RNA polymerase sigma factor (sigma-70 family)